jgi:hypothetical protein
MGHFAPDTPTHVDPAMHHMIVISPFSFANEVSKNFLAKRLTAVMPATICPAINSPSRFAVTCVLAYK